MLCTASGLAVTSCHCLLPTQFSPCGGVYIEDHACFEMVLLEVIHKEIGNIFLVAFS